MAQTIPHVLAYPHAPLTRPQCPPAVLPRQFEILTSIRRLGVHHPDLLAKNKLGSQIIPFVAAQARSARSSVARNGLMAMDDLLMTCRYD